MQKSLSIILIFISSTACVRASDKFSRSELNNNGAITDKKTYPNVVQIRNDRGNGSTSPSCTGVFMGDYVLTAAHCVLQNFYDKDFKTTRPVEQISLVINANDEAVRPIKIEVHPELKIEVNGLQMYPDLAKLYLPPKTWTRVTPARIAKLAPERGDGITVVGFGWSLLVSDVSNSKFRSGTNKVYKSDYKWILATGINQINPENRYTVPWHGDSGAPLFNSHNEVVGILSSKKKDYNSDYHYKYSYTNIVTPYIHNWISCR